MKTKQKSQQSGPRRLPTIQLQGVEYFVDERLGEFRQVDNPHQRIDFDTCEGWEYRGTFKIVSCPGCRQEVCISRLPGDERPCPTCGKQPR